eukprot:6074767-Amphidinium_carterae.1
MKTLQGSGHSSSTSFKHFTKHEMHCLERLFRMGRSKQLCFRCMCLLRLGTVCRTSSTAR